MTEISLPVPDALVDELARRVATILREEGKLLERSAEDRWLSTREAATYLGLTPNALHKLTAAREIPFTQDAPGGKCWFLRSELDAWRQGER